MFGHPCVEGFRVRSSVVAEEVADEVMEGSGAMEQPYVIPAGVAVRVA